MYYEARALDQTPPVTNIMDFAMHRSMFIGCGGLGSEAVNLLKHRVKYFFGNQDVGALKFLAVDSADSGMGEDTDAEWLLDRNSEVLHLSLDGWRSLIKTHPGVKKWFPPLNSLRKEVRDKILKEFPAGAEGCGTTRIFGRLGLFNGAAEKVRDAITGFAKENVPPKYKSVTLKDDIQVIKGNKALHFYIISTLGGGSGTGIILDIAAIIRYVQQRLGITSTWHIYGVFVLPTLLARMHPSGSVEKINANSYAALRELQYFFSKHPFDAQYDQMGKMTVHCDNVTFDNSLFQTAFLIEGENQEGFQLKSRGEIANFISGMLFKLALTGMGSQYFHREIDITMRGIYSKLIPESTGDLMFESMPPSFCDFGWATLHIPLDSLVNYSRISTACQVIKYLGAIHGPESKKNYTQKDVITYFLSPQKGTQRPKFINKIGLDRIVNGVYFDWLQGRQVESGDEGDEGGEPIFNLSVFNQLKSFRLPENYADEVLAGSRDEILQRVRELKTTNIKDNTIEDICEDFLYGIFNVSPRRKPGESVLKKESRFGRAIDDALKMKGGVQFVLDGLEDLRDKLEDLQALADEKIGGISKYLRGLENNRAMSEKALAACSREFLSLVPVFGKKRLRNDLYNFLVQNNNYQKLSYQKKILEAVNTRILEFYKKQIDLWFKDLGQLKEKAKEALNDLRESRDKSIRDLTRRAGSDFIHRNPMVINKFNRLYANAIRWADLLKEIQSRGLKYAPEGGAPRRIPFSKLIRDVDGAVLVRLITEAVVGAEKKARKQLQRTKRNIFRLNFDNFTSDKEGPYSVFSSSAGGDIEVMHSQLRKIGAPMCAVEGFSGTRLIYNYADPNPWEKILHDFREGKFSNKATHVEVRMGIAPFQLKYIKDWYKDYKALIFDGEPLHIFRLEHKKDFHEPYRVYDFDKNPEILFKLAGQKQFGQHIIKEPSGKGWCFAKRIYIEKLHGDFCKFVIDDRKADIIREFQLNDRIYQEVSLDVIESLQGKRGWQGALKKLIKIGIIPASLMIGELFEVEEPPEEIKNSAGLFSIALKLGLIRKIETDRYQLSVNNRPDTPECDWGIVGSKDSFLKELKVNEPLYDRLCEIIIQYIETVHQDNPLKRKKLSGILCQNKVLPPYLHDLLRDEYGSA